jgi:zona occludens toxin (predicted ATPase)
MQVSTSRSVVIISGLLTLLVLSGGALALAFHNGWLRTGSSGPAADAVSADSQASNVRHDSVGSTAAASAAVDPAQTTTQDEAAVYRQKLDEAYRALDDAYAQIRVLQTPQISLASADGSDERITNHDRDDDRREQRSRRHASDHH